MGFFDPSYQFAFNPYMRQKRKKRRIPDNDLDMFEKFVLFNNYLKSLKEEDKPKKDEKKPDPKKVDTTGLSAFLMVVSFCAGQASLIYLMANMPK